jgi:starvation-inducible DNA-binding protein
MHDVNPEMAAKLAQVLADTVTANYILHGYHWNALGPNFGEMHDFFAVLYKDVSKSIDPLAENILKVGFPAPYLLSDYVDLCTIKEERLDGTSSQFMLQSALRVVETLHDCHMDALSMANSCNLQGLADFLAGRVDMYSKWKWQIKAYLGVR